MKPNIFAAVTLGGVTNAAAENTTYWKTYTIPCTASTSAHHIVTVTLPCTTSTISGTKVSPSTTYPVLNTTICTLAKMSTITPTTMGTIIPTVLPPPTVTYSPTPNVTTSVVATPTAVKPTPVGTAGAAVNAVVSSIIVVVFGGVVAVLL